MVVELGVGWEWHVDGRNAGQAEDGHGGGLPTAKHSRADVYCRKLYALK